MSCRNSTADVPSSRWRSSSRTTRLPPARRNDAATAAKPATGSDRSTPAGSRWATAPSGTEPAAALAVACATTKPCSATDARHSSASRVLPAPAAPLNTTP